MIVRTPSSGARRTRARQLDQLHRRIDAAVEATHPAMRDEVREGFRVRFDEAANIYAHSPSTEGGMTALAELAEEVAEIAGALGA